MSPAHLVIESSRRERDESVEGREVPLTHLRRPPVLIPAEEKVLADSHVAGRVAAPGRYLSRGGAHRGERGLVVANELFEAAGRAAED